MLISASTFSPSGVLNSAMRSDWPSFPAMHIHLRQIEKLKGIGLLLQRLGGAASGLLPTSRHAPRGPVRIHLLTFRLQSSVYRWCHGEQVPFNRGRVFRLIVMTSYRTSSSRSRRSLWLIGLRFDFRGRARRGTRWR